MELMGIDIGGPLLLGIGILGLIGLLWDAADPRDFD